MATNTYEKFKVALASAGIDLSAGTLKVILVDAADYTVDIVNHDFLDDVPAGARVATATLASVTLTASQVSSKSVVTLDAADTTFTAVTGDTSEALIIYKDTGVEGTSRLIAYMDSNTVTGLAVTPNGSDLTIQWSASGILTL